MQFLSRTWSTHHSNSRPKGLLKWPCLIIMMTIAYTARCLQFSERFQKKKKKCSPLIPVKSLCSLLFPTLSTYSPKLVPLCLWWCSPCSNSLQFSKCLWNLLLSFHCRSHGLCWMLISLTETVISRWLLWWVPGHYLHVCALWLLEQTFSNAVLITAVS